tara:strand:- start:37862 stop:38650 length:789 start_codon:yes stop_codon:yes gene_type:complete
MTQEQFIQSMAQNLRQHSSVFDKIWQPFSGRTSGVKLAIPPFLMALCDFTILVSAEVRKYSVHLEKSVGKETFYALELSIITTFIRLNYSSDRIANFYSLLCQNEVKDIAALLANDVTNYDVDVIRAYIPSISTIEHDDEKFAEFFSLLNHVRSRIDLFITVMLTALQPGLDLRSHPVGTQLEYYYGEGHPAVDENTVYVDNGSWWYRKKNREQLRARRDSVNMQMQHLEGVHYMALQSVMMIFNNAKMLAAIFFKEIQYGH